MTYPFMNLYGETLVFDFLYLQDVYIFEAERNILQGIIYYFLGNPVVHYEVNFVI